ncbi:MAG: phosphotriesterase [Chloroflexi bacterium]|nr:phosphotriesterase [Chloroflexota bacterium]
MSVVPTAHGSVDSSRVGVTLMHEHIFVLSSEILLNYPDVWGDEDQRVAEAARQLDALAAHGVQTIVDLTALGQGRFIPRIQRVADRTSINIVVATGLYTFGDVPFYFRARGANRSAEGVDALTDTFVRDITSGIGDTGVRAGILKCATDAAGLTRDVERVLRAVAQAHRSTGVPISTHTHVRTRRGLDQQRIFREEGVDLSRVVIGHSGDSTDIQYLEELIAAGSYLGMDRFGIDTILSFDERVNVVVQLCERGHAGRMVLSHDYSTFIDWFPERDIPVRFPNWHYLHIPQAVVPALKQRGVTDEQIHSMLVDNPRRIFERTGGY